MTVYEYIKSLSLDEMALFLSNFEWYLYICDADDTGDNLKRATKYLKKYMNKKPDLKSVLKNAADIREALVEKMED